MVFVTIRGQRTSFGSRQLVAGPLLKCRMEDKPMRVTGKNVNEDPSNRHNGSDVRRLNNRCSAKIYLGLYGPKNTGWGVCGRYFEKELSKIADLHVIRGEKGSIGNAILDGVVFQGLQGADFIPLFTEVRGTMNLGYVFFEKELTAASIRNSACFDLVLAGSTWCLERMRAKGIVNCDVLLQGIDPDIFFPIQEAADSDRFVVFSGGKFELRKSQDLVLRALKIFQERHSDVWLVDCWYNTWEASVRMMESSQLINFRFDPEQSWDQNMLRTYIQNGLDPNRILTCDLVPNEQLRRLYAQTDIGIFPNRCEGGTNLVMMEYMACGKPVIASHTSGHRDILTPENALCLNALQDLTVVDPQGNTVCRWQEPSLDELLAQLEYAYGHRAAIAAIGHRAGETMKKFTWKHAAERLAGFIQAPV
jgi:glycosyltransferase involved in cell wall biosynthesis